MNIIERIKKLSNTHWYWLFYIAVGLSLLASALYFQFINDELPCLMCIQVRLIISLLIVVSCAALLLRSNRVLNLLLHLSVVFIAVALAERSYQLLGTERGFIFSDCGFSLGLPAWFKIEDWIPWLYRVETSCGYTPEIIFGITIAEVLMVTSVLFLLLSFSVFLLNVTDLKKKL